MPQRMLHSKGRIGVFLTSMTSILCSSGAAQQTTSRTPKTSTCVCVAVLSNEARKTCQAFFVGRRHAVTPTSAWSRCFSQFAFVVAEKSAFRLSSICWSGKWCNGGYVWCLLCPYLCLRPPPCIWTLLPGDVASLTRITIPPKMITDFSVFSVICLTYRIGFRIH